jgi:hypothetical protein
MSLAVDSVVRKKDLKRTKLTIAQIAFIDFNGTVLSGSAAQIKDALMALLPSTDGHPDSDDSMPELVGLSSSDSEEDNDQVPDYETQDADVVIDVPLDQMTVGDCVEVFWKGDGVWYEGKILCVDLDAKQFEVEYFLDGQTLLHNDSEYKVRMSC